MESPEWKPIIQPALILGCFAEFSLLVGLLTDNGEIVFAALALGLASISFLLNSAPRNNFS